MKRALILLAALLAARNAAADGRHYHEAPALQELVTHGQLPTVEQRLPIDPAIATFEWPEQVPGRYGGELDMLSASSKDARFMTQFCYARLVTYNSKYELVPDILKSFDVEQGRVFTLHLRRGQKWSDGSPFTTEDFRYYWEDVANNAELSPAGPPVQLLVDGEPPKVDALDKWTIRYSWSKPNAEFLPAPAGAYPLYIYQPSAYLKKYHKKYAKPDKLAKEVKEGGARSWAGLQNRKNDQYKNNNPKLPTLDAWVLKTKPPADRFVFERNPYYYRVDPAGRQLPYIDRIVLQIADSKLIPAKTGAGESMLQAQYLKFDDYTFLKSAEKSGGYKVLLWKGGVGSRLALYPNLTVSDPVWRRLNRDVRFRRALSLAIDRHEINQVVYYGLAQEAANTVLPSSPLYKPDYQTAYAKYDTKTANDLLDAIGLTKRDSDGFRLLPDGRPLTVIVDVSGQVPEESDVLELIRDSWAKIGVRLFTKPSVKDVFRDRVFSGESIMSAWSGLENGLPTANDSPSELAPVSQMDLEWSRWGQFFETDGPSGERPDLAQAKQLLALLVQWRLADNGKDRAAIWARMLAIHADEVFTIGTVAGRRSQWWSRTGCTTSRGTRSTASNRARSSGSITPISFGSTRRHRFAVRVAAPQSPSRPSPAARPTGPRRWPAIAGPERALPVSPAAIRRAMKGSKRRSPARAGLVVQATRMKRRPPPSWTMAASCRVWLVQPAFDQSRAPLGKPAPRNPTTWLNGSAWSGGKGRAISLSMAPERRRLTASPRAMASSRRAIASLVRRLPLSGTAKRDWRSRP
jgi:peptide/nickel transport system substrate-binding protein